MNFSSIKFERNVIGLLDEMVKMNRLNLQFSSMHTDIEKTMGTKNLIYEYKTCKFGLGRQVGKTLAAIKFMHRHKNTVIFTFNCRMRDDLISQPGVCCKSVFSISSDEDISIAYARTDVEYVIVDEVSFLSEKQLDEVYTYASHKPALKQLILIG